MSERIDLQSLAAVLLLVGIACGVSTGCSDFPKPSSKDAVRAELASVLQIPDANERARALADFFSHADPVNAEALQQVMWDYGPYVDEVLEALFVAWWARSDPGEALAARPRKAPNRDLWSRTVIREWVRTDPRSALSAVLEMDEVGDSVARQEAVRALINGWFAHPHLDPGELVPVLKQIGEIRARGVAINQFVRRMIETRGADAAQSLAMELEDPVGFDHSTLKFKREVIGRLASMLAREDPKRALAFVERQAGSPYAEFARIYLAEAWGGLNGPAALAWAATLKTPDAALVAERTWRSAVAKDREAACKWMAEQRPETPGLEAAFSLYLVILAGEDPRAALARVDEIAAPRHRNRVLSAVGYSWLLKDLDAAEAWIASADLPAEVVSEIRRGPQGRRPNVRPPMLREARSPAPAAD